MAGLSDFFKNTLGIADDDLQLLQISESVIGAVSGISGALNVLKTVLSALGIFAQIDQMQQYVSELVQDFEVVLAAEDQVSLMRDVADKVELARTELENLEEFAPDDPSATGVDPTWDSLRGEVLDNSLTAVNTLGDGAYWLRPFYTEGVYSSAWSGPLNPPRPSQSPNLVFDYRLTLAGYLEVISIRVTILAAMVKKYTQVNKHELDSIATKLEGYFEIIRAGIVELRAPSIEEISATPSGPDSGTPLIPSTWSTPGLQLFGVVDVYSMMHLVDSWPITEINGDFDIIGETIYQQFIIVHLVRTMSRWKRLYTQIGLASTAAAIANLKLLAGTSPAAVTGPTGDWSLRELAQRLSAVADTDFSGGIRLSNVLQTLQAWSPQPYTSLRAALAQ
jgi:hypothetical protein